MSEFKEGIFNIVNKFINGNSAALAVIYTIGHIFIAMACIRFITGASMELAAVDAIVEPMINGVWFYALHKTFNKVKPPKQLKTRNKEYIYA